MTDIRGLKNHAVGGILHPVRVVSSTRRFEQARLGIEVWLLAVSDLVDEALEETSNASSPSAPGARSPRGHGGRAS
jgi:hypothetical protein